MIYQRLKRKYSMVSFSTVYNTLNVLKDLGEIVELTVGDKKSNYDPETEPHHHFQCEKCGRIKDIHQKVDLDSKWIDGHQTRKFQIYFYGTCLDCLEKKKTN